MILAIFFVFIAFRITWAVMEMSLQILAVLLFAPVTRRKVRSSTSGMGTRIGKAILALCDKTPEDEGPAEPTQTSKRSNPRSHSTTVISKPAAPVERTPNHLSLIVALKQLGFDKPVAERVAGEVVDELGGHAQLNDMIKLGLRKLGPSH